MALRATRAEPGALEAADPLIERLDLPDEALANLSRLSGVDEEELRDGTRWTARVELDGTRLLVGSDGARWSIAFDGGDEAEAALAARRLHGMLGALGEGWDDDR